MNQQCPVSNLNVVSHAVICTNVLSAGCGTQKLFFINWQAFSRQTFFGSKGSYKNFSVLMKCTNKFDCLVYEMFLLTNWDLLSMYTDLTQFVLRFLISFPLVFFLCMFYRSFLSLKICSFNRKFSLPLVSHFLLNQFCEFGRKLIKTILVIWPFPVFSRPVTLSVCKSTDNT